MYEVVAVGVAQGARDLLGDAHGFVNRQLLFAVQPVAQRFALDERHDVEKQSAGLAGVVQR